MNSARYRCQLSVVVAVAVVIVVMKSSQSSRTVTTKTSFTFCTTTTATKTIKRSQRLLLSAWSLFFFFSFQPFVLASVSYNVHYVNFRKPL